MKNQTFIATTTDQLHPEFVEKLAAAGNNDSDAKQNLGRARNIVREYYPAIHEARIQELRTLLARTTDPRLRRALELQIAGYEKAVVRVRDTVERLKEEGCN